jgi:hypothetical protein
VIRHRHHLAFHEPAYVLAGVTAIEAEPPDARVGDCGCDLRLEPGQQHIAIVAGPLLEQINKRVPLQLMF